MIDRSFWALPENWKVETFKTVCNTVSGKAFDSGRFLDKQKDGYTPVIRIRDIHSTDTESYTNEEFQSKYKIETGDLLVGMDGNFEAAFWKGEDAALNQRVLKVETTDEVKIEWVKFWFDIVLPVIHQQVPKATVKHLSVQKHLDPSIIPIPSLSEQEQIVEALEERLQRVNRLETGLRSVRQLSREYEESIMSYLFSNTDFDSKNSAKNLPGKNDIPEDWEITTLGDMAHFQNGNGFSKSQWEDEGKPIIRIQNLTGTGDSYNYFSGEVHSRYAVENGDILFSWSGTIDAYRWTGGDAWLNQHIYRVDVEESVNEDYMFHLLKRSAEILEKKKVGGTLQHIRKGDVTGLQVPLPPKSEQREIVEKLESIDFSLLEKSISDTTELLDEYRNSVLLHTFQGMSKVNL